MYRTCHNCYAAETGKHPMNGNVHGCSLEYKNDGNGKPLEDCPKPKSWKQLNKLKGDAQKC